MEQQSIYPRKVQQFQSAQRSINMDILQDIHDDVASMKDRILTYNPEVRKTPEPEDSPDYPQEVTRFKSGKSLSVNILQEINEDIDDLL